MVNTLREEKRKERRVEAYLPIRFRFKDSSRRQSSLIRDLSSGGLRLIADSFLPKQSSVLLELELKELPYMLNMAGKIAWVKNLGFADRCYAGVKFQDLDKETRGKLEEYLQLQSALDR